MMERGGEKNALSDVVMSSLQMPRGDFDVEGSRKIKRNEEKGARHCSHIRGCKSKIKSR